MHWHICTILLCFFYLLELKMKIPFKFWIRLFVTNNLSTNKTMFDGKIAEKNRKNRKKGLNSGRVLKSRRVEYLDNKLTERKNNYTVVFVSSIRIFWYATRLYSKNFEKWPFLTFDLEKMTFCPTFFLSTLWFSLTGGPMNNMAWSEFNCGGGTSFTPSIS